ncbi:diacylglycerol kinase [Tetragenococcus osmophilus]|uniref:Diacylglycerol kinase n=1 Tax=Tetragenococcus osmophilus TaxID=526944 RepID=A0AA37XK14_9ENTE|nr:YegS/Rv2252/BmrU family lipid kinase [Tetragenococcus osmophilus]AYW48132.1 diacylglycerol kinase [Tetragenococcus osmophilus]GMA53894.1 diacylglycerol kinase [Alicyclobacillus contaminans]GMA72197.1 diacylglycerol kinase [Tetragenococcus osmophilus]
MEFHYYLLINPKAGGGKGKKCGEQIIATMKYKRLAFTVLETQFPFHEKELVYKLLASTLLNWNPKPQLKAKQPFPLLIVIGGDGTLHQVLNSLTAQIPIAYIPAGTGNDFARSLGLLQPSVKVLEQILQATWPRKINILKVFEQTSNDSKVCINNVGIGLDAAIVHATNHSTTKQRLYKYKAGFLSYIPAVLQTLFKQEDFPVTVKCEDETYYFKHAFLCTLTNHPYFGGGVNISPAADINEPQVDLTLVEKLSMGKIFYLILLLALKKHAHSKHFHRFKASTIQINSPSKQFIQQDGEDFAKTPCDFHFSSTKQLFWF